MTRLASALRVGAAAILLSLLAPTTPAHASKCPSDTVFNPITKVRWNCIFPITIGGVRVGSYDKLDKALDAQSASKPLCACRKGATFWFGVKVSFWTPNRMVDVVTEPGCMTALGVDGIGNVDGEDERCIGLRRRGLLAGLRGRNIQP